MNDILEVDPLVPPKRLCTLHDEFKNPTEKQSPQNSNFLKGVKWSPDGVCYLTAADDNCFRIYDIPSSLASDSTKLDRDAENLDKNSTGLDQNNDQQPKDPYSPALRIHAGELIYDYTWYPWASATDPATCCFAVTTRAHPIHLYDAISGQLRCSYRPFNALDEMEAAYSIGFSPDGSKIFAGGRNSVIYIFDLNRPGRDHSTLFTFSKNENKSNGQSGGQPGIISCIACAKNTTGLMAAGSYSGLAALYDYRTPTQQLAVLEGHTGGITNLKFSPCGTYLYTGARKDGLIYCWDARNMSGAIYALKRDVNTTNQRIYFDIENCGRHLASGGEDGFVKFWDLRDGSEAGKFRVAENDTVNGCEFHPSLPVLATATGHRRFFQDDDESSDDEENSSDEEQEEGDDAVKYVRSVKGQFSLSRDQNSLSLWGLETRAATEMEPEEEGDEIIEITDETEERVCGQDLAVRWHTEVTSSIYATPIITDLYNDGRKDIVVPGFRRRLHILEGRTGAEDTTFEAQHRSTLHASPLLYDIDFDGVLDIVVATYDGDIQFFKDTGAEASYRLFIPRLRVKHDWYAGLNPDPNDHSHPDVGADSDDSGIGERVNIGRKRREGGGSGATTNTNRRRSRSLLQVDVASLNNNANLLQREEISEEAAESFTELFADEERTQTQNQAGGGAGAGGGDGFHEPDNSSRNADWLDESNIYDEIEDEDYEIPFVGGEEEQEEEDNTDHVLHGGNVRHVHRGHRGRQERPHGHGGGGAHYNDDEFIEEETDDYFNVYAPPDIHSNNNNENENSRDYQAKAELWEDDNNTAPEEFSPEVDAPYVWIDAHVMATPSIADIDNDGRDELVVPVSYFFDPGDYSADSARARAAVGKDGDPGKYLASGIVVYDLHTRGIKWSQHLDLSTRYTRYKAEIHSIPTLADIDNDGRLEVIVGTSMGWVYVLDPKTGDALDGWPVQLGDVQGQVAVGDIDNDGWLEIIAADARGSVVALRLNGKEVWERHVGSAIGIGATLADFDGDGSLEIVIGTFDGRIFVLDGLTGKDKPGFPFRTYGRITAPIMVTKLSDPKLPGLQLVATAHDGFLYVIDSLTACADTLDLGEPSYAMVLADDLAHTGRMDLLVATAGGNIYAIRTPSRFQPLKVWPSQAPGTGTAGFVAKWNWEGIYATAASRVPRDVRGEAVQVRVTVVDKRPPLSGGKLHGPYKISVSLQGVGAKEMEMGDQPVIGMSNIVNKTGTYVMEIPCPKTRTSATIRVEMRDETGAVFSDEFALSFHIHFYRLLKWLAVGPFAFTAAAVLFMSGRDALRVELPS